MLRRTLESGGAAFIKWGQWASTRYDVFPAQLCKELEMLQAGAPEHSWRKTREILERAYGGEQLDEIFAWMDKAPIASGSIAQIHRAKLRNGVAEKNGARTFTIHERLLRSVGSGVELLAKGEWRGLLLKMRSEWYKSAGKWEWNPSSYLPVNPMGGTKEDDSAVVMAGDVASSLIKALDRTMEKPLGERPDDKTDEGRYVAVKVRHPGVVEALRRDFAILAWIARATRSVEVLKPFQLEHTVQQVRLFLFPYFYFRNGGNLTDVVFCVYSSGCTCCSRWTSPWRLPTFKSLKRRFRSGATFLSPSPSEISPPRR